MPRIKQYITPTMETNGYETILDINLGPVSQNLAINALAIKIITKIMRMMIPNCQLIEVASRGEKYNIAAIIIATNDDERKPTILAIGKSLTGFKRVRSPITTNEVHVKVLVIL